MGLNSLSWRKVQRVNREHGTRFVHGVLYSHHKFWVWELIDIAGNAVDYDTRAKTFTPVESRDGATTTQLLLQNGPSTDAQREWFDELHRRHESLTDATQV